MMKEGKLGDEVAKDMEHNAENNGNKVEYHEGKEGNLGVEVVMDKEHNGDRHGHYVECHKLNEKKIADKVGMDKEHNGDKHGNAMEYHKGKEGRLGDQIDMDAEHNEDEHGSKVEYHKKGGKNKTINIIKPHVGMVFKSDQHAFQFYSSYARKVGFRVRKGGVRRSLKNDEIIGRRLFCSRQGFREERFKKNEATKKRHRRETRVGCQARLVLVRAKDGKWVASIFEEEHNHTCETPKKLRIHLSPKRIDESEECEEVTNYSSQEDSNSVDFVEKEAVNYLYTRPMKNFKMGDAQALLNYLNQVQLENPHFLYAIQLDVYGQMTNLFWTDAKSRMDYHYFGDVVCIDLTYGTNAFGMPFVPIFGINHHMETTLFGCALILDETEASFVWLLETWMSAMKGCHPKVIFTDIDSAITRAISHIFPQAHHRFCLWHVFQESKKYMDHLFLQGCDFDRDFSHCLRDSETIEEFEFEWDALLVKYYLQGNEWMTRLYSKRQHWVPVYLRDIFCADMSATERRESIRKFFDGFLNKNMLPKNFVKGVDRALVSWRENEIEADSYTSEAHPPLVVHMYIEEAAAKVYTTSVFKIFQEELINGLRYMCDKVEQDGNISTYKCWMLERENRHYIVKFSSTDSSLKCSCRKFEFMGILCRHILKVFIVTNVHHIPSQYILKRWTRDACAVADENGEQLLDNHLTSLSLRYSSLCYKAMDIATKGASSVDTYKVVMHWLQKAEKEVDAALRRQTTEIRGSYQNDSLVNSREVYGMEGHALILPSIVKSKGQPSKPKGSRERKHRNDKILRNSNLGGDLNYQCQQEMRGRAEVSCNTPFEETSTAEQTIRSIARRLNQTEITPPSAIPNVALSLSCSQGSRSFGIPGTLCGNNT